MGTVQLDDAAVFVSVVDAGSFSKAARTLSQPKSSVSRAVSRLERDLGVKLLERTTRSLRLTDAGKRYHAGVAPALTAVRDAQREVGALAEEVSGTLRISAPVDFGVAYLAEVVAAFTAEYPNVTVDAALTSRPVDLVREGFDLALRFGRLADSSLVARKVGELSDWLLAAPSYLKRARPLRSPQDLSKHDCVLFRSAEGKARWDLCSKRRTVRVDVAGRVLANDLLYVKRAAVAGAGIVLVPWFMSREELDAGTLVRVLPNWERRGAAFHIVVPSARFMPRKVAAFRDFLIEQMTVSPLWSKR
ncbi:MAG: LysR family transcriptional regulator [Polyangiaceae bacterium]